MYPGKFLSLANKGWDWAPLLKHVGIWVKKKSEKYMKKKERKNYKKSYKNFGASKLSMKFKDQNSKNPKSWRYQKLVQVGEFKDIKDEMFKEVKNSKNSIVVSDKL